MRTILYQPVYINPQAYFAFPSLYHIEKGDSYVEPAVYTGQLLIDVVDGSASSVIIKDTRQVDFNDYAGKHIRISQYTDEGAVVLEVVGLESMFKTFRYGCLGIVVPEHARKSVNGSKVILHYDFVSPVLTDEDKLTVYEHNSRELGNILNNEEWNKNEEIL